MLNPEFSSQRIEEAFAFKDPTDLERLKDGLRIAGFSQQVSFWTNVA